MNTTVDFYPLFSDLFAYLGDEEDLGEKNIVPVTRDVRVRRDASDVIMDHIKRYDWDSLQTWFTTMFGERASPLISICNNIRNGLQTPEDIDACMDCCEGACEAVFEACCDELRYNENGERLPCDCGECNGDYDE
jgi:hypothetical protein